MGREFIGECETSGEDPAFDNREMELAIEYIKQACGQPPRGVDVQIAREDHELGSYPVIAVIWDDSITEYPDEYIGRCIEAFERCDSPEETYELGRERSRVLREIHALIQQLFDPD
jgi:hypothetical protein